MPVKTVVRQHVWAHKFTATFVAFLETAKQFEPSNFEGAKYLRASRSVIPSRKAEPRKQSSPEVARILWWFFGLSRESMAPKPSPVLQLQLLQLLEEGPVKITQGSQVWEAADKGLEQLEGYALFKSFSALRLSRLLVHIQVQICSAVAVQQQKLSTEMLTKAVLDWLLMKSVQSKRVCISQLQVFLACA